MTNPVPVTHPLHVGTIVRDRRRALGLRQTDVAAAAGVGANWVRALELGRKNPGFANMVRVLGALDIACALVLRDEPAVCAAPRRLRAIVRTRSRYKDNRQKLV